MINAFKRDEKIKRNPSLQIPYRWSVIKWVSVYLLIIIAICCTWFWFNNKDFAPIKKVTITGEFNHIDMQQVKNTTMPYLASGFFSLDTEQLKQALLNCSWVKEVEIRRQWPDRLAINITEQHAFALWNDISLVNAQGELFSAGASAMPVGLPRLYGPNEKQKELIERFGQLSAILAPLQLQITELRLTARGSYQLEMSNHITVMLGKNDFLPKFEKFVQIYPKLQEPNSLSAGEMRTVDLRYSNGIAVNRVKTAAETELTKISNNQNNIDLLPNEESVR